MPTLVKRFKLYATDVTYHSYFPRILVSVRVGDEIKTVELRAKCEEGIMFLSNKEECKKELEGMSIKQIKDTALVKAAKEDFMD